MAEQHFLALSALLSVTSVWGSDVSKWAHVPNPPIFQPVFRGDDDELAYAIPSILTPPWNNWTKFYLYG